MTHVRSAVKSSIAVLLALTLGGGWALGAGVAKPKTTRSAYAANTRPATGRFTLAFVDADVVDVFQALAAQSGVNIATGGSVTGKVTLHLRGVELQQALNIVTKLNGLDYAWVDGAYVIGTPEEVRSMKVADLRTSVVVLRYIQPTYAQEAVSRLTPDVTISTQKGERSILLLGPETSLAKAERVLSEIDLPPAPQAPKAQVLPVRYLKADQLAAMISASVPECPIQPGPQENSLLITANDQQWETIKSIADAADAKPLQAQASQQIYRVKYAIPDELSRSVASLVPDLQITLAPRTFTPSVQRIQSATATGGASLLAAPQYGGAGGGGSSGSSGSSSGSSGGTQGLTEEAAPVTALIVSGAPWTVERGMKLLEQLDKSPRQIHIAATVTEVSRDDATRLGIDWTGLGAGGAAFTFGEPLENDKDGNPDATLMRQLSVGTIMRTPIQWSNTLHALEEKGRARVLSNPSVTVLDGRQTAMHTGDTILYQVVSGYTSTGTAIMDTKELQVGISLSVNPRSNDNGEVTLTLTPAVSSVSSYLNGLPQVTERAVVTTVRVKSGETAVIAGLVTDEERVSTTGVPYLSKLPVLGELFKYRSRSPKHSEIMILVTPTIIDG